MVQEAWSVITRVLTMAAALCLAACAVDKEALEKNRVVADTGGYALRLIVRKPSTIQAELFEVNRQGKAGYAGGQSAIEGAVTFQRDLSEADAIKFRAAISECSWVVDGKPKDLGPEKAEPISIVSVTLPSGIIREFTLHGEQPQVDAFVTMIKPWVGDRHGRLLDKLPEATEPPKGKPQSPSSAKPPTD